MSVLSHIKARAMTFDTTGVIDATSRRINRELEEKLGDSGYPVASLDLTPKDMFIVASDKTGGTFDIAFTVAAANDFTVFNIPIGATFSTTQSMIDIAAGDANPGYSPGDISVPSGEFGAGGSSTHFIFSGPFIMGDFSMVVDADNTSGGSIDLLIFTTDEYVQPRFWFAALKTLGIIEGTDSSFGAAPAGQYTVNRRDTLENYPSDPVVRRLIKEASAQEGQDWESELLPLLGLDRTASGISY